MPVSSNVSTRVFKSNASNNGAASQNGARCHNTSCTCGRAGTPGHRATSVGQELIVTDLFLRQKQEQAKYNLLIFITRLMEEKVIKLYAGRQTRP